MTTRVIQNHAGGRGQAPAGIRASNMAVSSRATVSPMHPHDGKYDRVMLRPATASSLVPAHKRWIGESILISRSRVMCGARYSASPAEDSGDAVAATGPRSWGAHRRPVQNDTATLQADHPVA